MRPPAGFPLPELVLVSNRVLTEEAEGLRAAMEQVRKRTPARKLVDPG